MNSPLKQYRHFLLIPALLCTLSLLLFSAVKVQATKTTEEVPARSTYSSSAITHSLSPNFASTDLASTDLASTSLASTSLASTSLVDQPAANALIFNQSIPVFPKNGADGSATLLMHNEGAAEAAYQIQVYSAMGEPLYDEAGTIPSKGNVLFVADNILQIPNGNHHLAVASDRSLNLLASVEEAASESLGLYQGVVPLSSSAPFGPISNREPFSTTLILANTFAATGTVQIDLHDAAGLNIKSFTETVPALGSITVDFSAVADLPNGFLGTAAVSSPEITVAGVVRQRDSIGKQTYQNALSQQSEDVSAGDADVAVAIYLPRLFNEGVSGNQRSRDELPLRNSAFFVTTTGSSSATVVANAYPIAQGNSEVTNLNADQLNPNGSLLADLSTQPQLEQGLFSLVVLSDQPILGGQITTFAQAASYGADSYVRSSGQGTGQLLAGLATAATTIWLPRVVKTNDTNSTVTVQNRGVDNSTVQVDFFDQSGALIHTQTELEVGLQRAFSIDLALVSQIPSDFIGSVQIASNHPFIAQVDELHDFDPPAAPEPVALTISGPDRALLRKPIQAVASIALPPNTPGSAAYPAGYQWEPGDNSPVVIAFSSNGITSTGTMTWSNAGVKVVDVTANTGLGTVTEPYTVAVSARSMAISSMQTTTYAYNEFDGTSIQMLVPGQLIDGAIQLDYLPNAYLSGPLEQGFIGQGFDLNAFQNQQIVADYRLNLPMTLTIVYDAENMGSGNTALLHLRRWNGSAWVAIGSECGGPLLYDHERANQKLVVGVCQLGQFAFFGATETIFAPVIQ